MKQVMTLSAFLLSAACICVNTQTFAAASTAVQDTTNSVVNGTKNVVTYTADGTKQVLNNTADGTKQVMDGTGNVIGKAAQGITKATKDGFHAIEKGAKAIVTPSK